MITKVSLTRWTIFNTLQQEKSGFIFKRFWFITRNEPKKKKILYIIETNCFANWIKNEQIYCRFSHSLSFRAMILWIDIIFYKMYRYICIDISSHRGNNESIQNDNSMMQQLSKFFFFFLLYILIQIKN